MGWSIECCDLKCGAKTSARNIVDLIDKHRNEEGWFKCSKCQSHGYIEKRFALQEPGETWEPYLKGIVTLGNPEDIYQPFVFLVSYEPNGHPNDAWFSYYKDTRHLGGRLKLGYGPGGPPVLGEDKIIELVKTMVQKGCIERSKLLDAIKE
ncbi:hypothetical protein ACFOEK_06960 [Litoribrevibacter euphylliae]|uniref:Uncharacterized protein n=1 Tax=Litoribrevibacter euphylliae TaxID=1834034 RepID=A0ABV7HE84_9GAMM